MFYNNSLYYKSDIYSKNMKSPRLLFFILGLVGVLILSLFLKLHSLEKNSQEAALKKLATQENILQPLQKIKDISETDHIKGNKDAKVTLIEYSDFQCTFCQTIQPTIQRIMQSYGNNIRFVSRNYPLPQHPDAIKEAEAAECAAELGGNTMYWKYSEKIFAHSTLMGDGISIPLVQLTPLANQIGLDGKKFEACLNSGKYIPRINTDKAEAERAGINQLPSIIIVDTKKNSLLIAGNQPYEVYKSVIDLDLL